MRRGAGAFVGIKNGGATCYMNSLFQQLFMQPSIRHYLLAAPEVDADQRADSVFYQLQVRCSDVSHKHSRISFVISIFWYEHIIFGGLGG